ncbi:WecB/TagA/CpsF family glycosyltransferase [Rhodococcus sp. BP-349]|uniref:WecB/TagA/CpsF family glycosyltransferase n=1 Tax=unclassified Rhodococcus (in: high G+C Gram-positive bacteria) TaxID=192944 RepID=UPI001C9BAE65|nr:MULTISPECIES: WecB/TagA/CpsF family glycosyltransferase [unclassified Rhodococcus (in: high G+C Gram-positive bacteria)]MBY6539468.1 WecB/TagA/CpsF family glycosyltransferase [Rhodococcus sp. BP-363]MBY6544204.1 WecB/TagA/CpsF family glycosyltransferase [Rhodococcus sp. BP-369]MBY6563434.1 WecB/TagA/CpsF family glycosyltransferase [Rhodococcus sp. BP-370]MBY6577726.1 WecB/TagA/CpsF family glycosyltransferase [Rhodococcus sp. BP-364]MBY6587027.1 WecB/TagA/CpsF family glycosyltransferase [Rho
MTENTRTVFSVDARGTAFIDDTMMLFTDSSERLVATFADMLDSGRPRLVVTPNVDQVLRIGRDSHARHVFESAHLRVVDGMPLVALLRMLGCPTPQRNTGADLLPLLAGMSAARGWVIAIVGGGEGVAGRAAEALSQGNPGASVTAVDMPMLTSPDDPAGRAAVDALCAISPDFVFLCMGFPKQESWFLHWQELLPGGIYLGTGAAVDFAAGTVQRAPRILQRVGLEWAFRLAQEPRRLARRYLVEGPGFMGVVVASMHRRRRTRSR